MLRCEHLLCYFSEYAVLLMNTGKLDEAIQKFTSIVKVMKLKWHSTKIGFFEGFQEMYVVILSKLER